MAPAFQALCASGIGCGMGRVATLRLTERGIRVVGTDAWSWDAPPEVEART